MKKIIIGLLSLFFICPLISQAAPLKNDYSRLANYYLKWEISDLEARELAKWDLLILDMELQENSRTQLLKIRELNPDIIILVYLNSVEILDNLPAYQSAKLRNRLSAGIIDAWWLRDTNGRRISNWPDNFMLNLTDGADKDAQGNRFNDYLPNFVFKELKQTNLWDGIYYDNTWGDISWLNSGNLDADNDNVRDKPGLINQAWSSGFKKMLAKTRELVGSEFIIVGNGRVYNDYQGLMNGAMLEDFPSTWENGGTWSGSIKTYLNLPTLNLVPNVSIINTISKDPTNYRLFRFGLVSALLGNGFYSFDYDISNHGQTWWYDEYDVSLGAAQSGAYNLIANKGTEIKAGLWRRDFKYGSAIVNSTDKEQLYVFSKEEMEKIKGVQDPKFNTGLKINYLKLAPQDGAILLRRNALITDNAFKNGYFYRIYNINGRQTRNGFFSYFDSFPGEQEIIIAGQEALDQNLILTVNSGQVILQKKELRSASFFPYTKNYRGPINLAAENNQGEFKQIVTGPGAGGGPQVRIFSSNGKLLGDFFAYEKNSRGGVSVALGDLNNDKQNEIITGPGLGLEPVIKIFSFQGVLKNSFLAYDKNFKGGVNVAVGDVNGDGQNEIITSPDSGGGPQVRIFNAQGKVLSSFFAYDKSYHGGIKIGASDIDDNGQAEILVGIKNFY